MSWMAVPLYAAAQGLPNAQIGTLLSIPVLVQAPLNLVGGAYTDRLGGRRILVASTCAMAAAALWLLAAQGFWMLILGQFALAFSRAVFWPSTWAMASELPGARGEQLGRLNAATNIGQIGGNLLCGVLLAASGFAAAFGALSAIAAAALLAALKTADAAPRGLQPARSPFALGGLGWNASLLATPLAMGYLADRIGLPAAFYAIALALLASVGALAAMRRWAF